MLRFLALIGSLAIVACAHAESSVYWSDGDSGRINGVPFRLANVDAPETGGVGAFGGAKCESERVLGYEAKAFIIDLTRDAKIAIARDYGKDRYDRLVIDLSADGKDVGAAGVAAGHLRSWPHDKGRALASKPDWCNAYAD